ncbi:hypothetical protein HN588_00420 [Candidatus Bathyarchaeota archaeon]|nr:hypothetical protein [Candidatus Bathyarchaeota archaeon]
MGFDKETKEMMLIQVHPGVTVDDVIENTGFELLLGDVRETDAPTDEELKLLREEIDPSGIVIGK